jgi:hypothetical protein
MLTLERKIGALVAARRASGEMVVARYQRRMSSLGGVMMRSLSASQTSTHVT